MEVLGYVFLVLIGATIIRFSQFYRWHARALARHRPRFSHPLIIMLSHYHDTEEFEQRIKRTAELFHSLYHSSLSPLIVVTVGALKGMSESIGDVDKRMLVERGRLEKYRVTSYQGRRARGAADTFQEVLLACEYAHYYSGRDSHVVIVTNPLQAIQAFMICLRAGIFPLFEITPLLETSSWYVAGKLFQIVLTFYSPCGWNPLSWIQRGIRRYITSTV